MALGVRQLALYRDTMSLYKPTNSSGTSSIGAVKEPLYELVEADIPCKYSSNENTSFMGSFGRIESGAKDELENIYCEADNVIHDQYCIKFTTPDHPLENAWYTVIGEPDIRALTGNRKANYLHVHIRGRSKAPTIRS